MSFSTNRVDEAYCQRIIDDFQQDYNNLFNSLKNGITQEYKEKLKNNKIYRHTKLLTSIMNSALLLKQLL